MDVPEVRYARNGDVAIAYQVLGDGPVDLLFVPGFASNLLWNWQLPLYARFLTSLASFSRLIVIDRRGTGLSDRFSPDDLPPLETLAEDLGVVLDAVGSPRAALFGCEDGGLTCSLFAATHPDRSRALVLYSMSPGRYEGGWSDETWQAYLDAVATGWGTRSFAMYDYRQIAPSHLEDRAIQDWYVAYLQLGASPAAARALLRLYRETDVRSILPSIRVPTLVLHREGNDWEPNESSRITARLIPDARLVEPPGADHAWFLGDVDALVAEVRAFLTGSRSVPDVDRVLSTVLFTDIVGSTERATELGDRAWRELLGRHDDRLRAELTHFGGREIDTAGDGFFATFDGPARAVRCAHASAEAVRELGIEIRAGVHTGEVELEGDDVRGIAVHIGARVAALAGRSEILVSSTVKDLVAGSGLVFEDAGEHELKGVPDRWHLYRVAG